MTTNFQPDTVILKLEDSVSPTEFADLQAAMGATKVTTAEQFGIHILQIPSGTVLETISAFINDPRIKYIEQDPIITLPDVQTTSRTKEKLPTTTPQTTTPNDPDFSELWGLHNTGQTGGTSGADISFLQALPLLTGTQKKLVGVIDSGIDYTHPDLAPNMWKNPREIAGDNIDNDNNRYIDDVHGWNFVNNTNKPMDDNEHGTHVAGIIGAVVNNLLGVSGVAADHVLLVALKFLDASGSGSTSNAILALDYATANGILITNNSWGGLLPIPNKALEDAIEAAGKKGGLFVAAAGNSSTNNDAVAAYPASYDLANIISVASTTHDDELSSFSNYGETVDIGAPGSDIYSTLPGGKYGFLSGTSMASPHVAGAAALLLSQNPSLTPQEVKNRLVETTDPIIYPPEAILAFVFDLISNLDAGRLNVANALGGSTSNDNSNLGETQLRIASSLSPAAPANLTETAKAEAGEDFLTGGPGADTLMLPFAQSSVSPKDLLTDFGSEIIDLVRQGGAVIDAPSLFTVPTLEKGAIPVFAEANGALAGKQALEINSDLLRVAKTGWMADIYPGIYDAKQRGI